MNVGITELTRKSNIFTAELLRVFLDAFRVSTNRLRFVGLQIIFRHKTVFKDTLGGSMFCVALFVKHWPRAIGMFLLIG